METSSAGNLARQGQTVAAMTSDVVRGVRDEAAPILRNASSQALAAGKRGIGAIGEMVSQASDAASDASDSIIAYTKKNPAKALTIAAVAGALLFALARANSMRRN